MIQTELKSEKVELEKVELEKIQLETQEDLRNYLNSLLGSIKTLEGDFQLYKSLRNRVQSEAANGEQRIKQINANIRELRAAAKKFGLKDSVFPDIKRAEKAEKDFKSLTQGRAKLGGLLSL
jgi:chromosome segregation ATPase